MCKNYLKKLKKRVNLTLILIENPVVSGRKAITYGFWYT